ncbi:acetyltransferase family protein [Brevibacillus laterosporus GI-9]|uniref:GNAT family N-acetyltransferase n=1 Tax=Brevibacillus laterosporus TaxID=1465 RepID=UPI0002404B32|nr:GNAT family protein [Brevibacillus laterosporus]CCF13691.1 acetyltransferase family protein [Brevibacillus laterosporus GI-9]
MKNIVISPDLELKEVRIEDAAVTFALIEKNRDYLREFLPWLDNVRDVEDSENNIRFAIQQAANMQGTHYSIWYRGQLAGRVAANFIEWNHRKTVIGYWLGAEFQGKGIMTQAVEAYLDYLVFGKWNLHRAEIAAAVQNEKSRAIPERLGFQLEGIMRGNEWLYDHYVDHAVYGMLQQEWKQRKKERKARSPIL